jgi:hypothetical protein
MNDEQKGKGWQRPGPGRPPQVVEMKARQLGLEAIKKVFGSEGKYWEHIAMKAADSFPHLMLIHQYIYGKPLEKYDINTNGAPIIQVLYAGDQNNVLNNGGEVNTITIEANQSDPGRDVSQQDLLNPPALDSVSVDERS